MGVCFIVKKKKKKKKKNSGKGRISNILLEMGSRLSGQRVVNYLSQIKTLYIL